MDAILRGTELDGVSEALEMQALRGDAFWHRHWRGAANGGECRHLRGIVPAKDQRLPDQSA